MIKSNKKSNDIELGFELQDLLQNDGAEENSPIKKTSPDIKNEQSNSIKSTGNVSSTEDDTDGTKQKAKVAKFKI